MSKIQEIEIKKYHNRIVKDVNHLIERYREIMAWDIPDNDPQEADKLIFEAVKVAIKECERN